MSTPHRFILEPYKGPSTRHTCPQCRKPKELARYVDTSTGELLPEHVGKCNRADACGYHYPPRDYFRDSGTRPEGPSGGEVAPRPEPPPRPPYLHQRGEVVALRASAERNTLTAYWRGRIGAERWDAVSRAYALGTWPSGPLAGAAVYWQADIHGRVKAGKIMLYDPATGKRRKDVARSTSFVHFERTGRNASDLNVEQCLFGEHLLKDWPMDAPVAVVESEKTAMIAAAIMPELRWVAVGSLGGFTMAKLHALTGRRVLAFPDLSPDRRALNTWKEKAVELGRMFAAVVVSEVLEREATEDDRQAGLDIADLLLRRTDGNAEGTGIVAAPAPRIVAQVRNEAEALLIRWAQDNPALLTLVDELDIDLGRGAVLRLPRTEPSTPIRA